MNVHTFHTFRLAGRWAAIYPTCCTSAFCGGGGAACATCPQREVKEDFEAWVREHDATVLDPIWSPTVYVERKQ